MRLLGFCLLLAAVSATNPGLRLVLDQGTISQAVSLGLSQFPHTLPISLGDFSYQTKFLDMHFGVSVRNLTLLTANIDALATGVVISDPNIVAVNMQVVSAQVSCELELVMGLIKHWTSVLVDLSGIQVNTEVEIQANANNKPQIGIESIDFSVKDMDFSLSSKVKNMQFLQSLLWLGKEEILKAVNGLVGKAAVSAVPSVNSLLATLPMTVSVMGLTVDLSEFYTDLQGSPSVVGNSYLSIPLNATILAAGSEYPASEPSPTPVINPNGLPVQVFLTDYLLQSAVVALWPLLNVEVEAFPLPFEIITGFSMDTDSFQMVMPELYAHYGEKKIQLTISSSAALPLVKLNMGLQATIPVNVGIAVKGTQGWEPVCAFNTTAYAGLSVLSEQLNYYLQVSDLTFLSLHQTSGLPVNVTNTLTSLNGLISLYFPDINGLFHNTVSSTQERLTLIGLPWLTVDALAVEDSAGYLQPSLQIRLV